MRGGKWLTCFLAITLLTFLPTVESDDDTSTANVLTNGVSSSDYVCYDDGCSPTDQTDWWKLYAYKGDIVEISFSGTMVNPSLVCIWGDGWEGDFSIHDSNGAEIASLALTDDNPTGTLSKTMPTGEWVYAKVKGKDSWCNDGFDYTVSKILRMIVTLLLEHQQMIARGVWILIPMAGQILMTPGVLIMEQMLFKTNRHNG